MPRNLLFRHCQCILRNLVIKYLFVKYFQLDWDLLTLFLLFLFPLPSRIYELCTNSIWCFKKMMCNMPHRTGREEETVDSNGKRLWKESSTYGKHMTIIWNNLGQLLVLKMPRQWRIVARLGGGGGWEDTQLTSENTDCHHVPHATGESLSLHTGKHILTSRNLSTTVFLPCLLPLESLLHPPQLPLIYCESHFIPNIDSWAMDPEILRWQALANAA